MTHTKDEALRLALEALDNLLYWDNGKPEYDEAREAITAIKQALADPVQEPVAEVIQADAENYKIRIIKPQPAGTKLYTTPPAAQLQSARSAWVGLTPEEVKYEWEAWRASLPRYAGFAKGIEAKLREKNAAQPAPVQEPTLQKQLDDAHRSRDFYKRRIDALQRWQSKMRDPERTIVCDILANGCVLEPAGDRYTPPTAPVQEERKPKPVPLTIAQKGAIHASVASMRFYDAVEFAIRRTEAAHGITAPEQKGGET